MSEELEKEVLLRLEQRGVNIGDLVQSGDLRHVCVAKEAADLEDPVDWSFFEGIISDERIEAFEAGAKPTDGEMQSMRALVVGHMFNDGLDDLPSAHFCTVPEEFGTQVIVFLVTGHPQGGWDCVFYGLFDNADHATDALREDFFLSCDID